MALPIRLILGLVASFQTVSAHRLLLTSLTDSEVKTSKQGKHWSPKQPLRGRGFRPWTTGRNVDALCWPTFLPEEPVITPC